MLTPLPRVAPGHPSRMPPICYPLVAVSHTAPAVSARPLRVKTPASCRLWYRNENDVLGGRLGFVLIVRYTKSDLT